MSEQSSTRALAFVRGNVQGVGFRWWTRARALELGLVGYARNLRDGRVEVCAQGGEEQIEVLLSMLEPDAEPAGRPGRVVGLVRQWHAARPELSGFRER
ncbi:acylphosphatase [Ornithinimicrobium sp. INDO-MA30-4]|uniref:acylphosphatase n=1 Tax=Ornithinimicrobium sp. INDO-MA30-4 TaxID=2908651 RepID=UPI001F2ED845|nr:acylphosphatase [Ornithinimicrobium sp. INDO-MA30-4]UJH70800.1 acylphosphatase [Ornithinimicrobium sp. INDO-MA30-4]